MSASAEQVRAIAAMPSDLAILKLENDTIQSLAAARPRDHHSIKADIIQQLEAYPAFAKAAIYAKPVGKDPDTNRQKIARGLSVRGAEAIAEAYGYCRIRTDVTPIDDDHVKVEATFTDYQKGRIWQDAGVLSKWYKAKGGGMVKHADDRFYNVVVKAEVSRRVREVILRSVPPGLRAELQQMAEERIGKLLDDKEVGKIIGYFGAMGVTPEQLEVYIGRSRSAGWTEDDRLNLHGLVNAIKDGETTVAEAFGDTSAKAAAKKTLDDLAKKFAETPVASSGNGTEPAAPEAPEPASAEATLRAELTAKLERAARFSADSLRKVRDEMCGTATRLDEAMREHAESEYQRLLPTAAPSPAKATRGKAAPAQGELLS